MRGCTPLPLKLNGKLLWRMSNSNKYGFLKKLHRCFVIRERQGGTAPRFRICVDSFSLTLLLDVHRTHALTRSHAHIVQGVGPCGAQLDAQHAGPHGRLRHRHGSAEGAAPEQHGMCVCVCVCGLLFSAFRGTCMPATNYAHRCVLFHVRTPVPRPTLHVLGQSANVRNRPHTHACFHFPNPCILSHSTLSAGVPIRVPGSMFHNTPAIAHPCDLPVTQVGP